MLSGVGLINASPTNVFRERGFRDGLQGNPNRYKHVHENYGREAGAAYVVGYRRGKERREAVRT